MTTARPIAALLVVVLAAGCDRNPETRYGTVRGESLNGVSAFVQMLRDAGHSTATRRTLAERMVGRHDVAVVFAAGFGPPEDDARELLGRFLAADGEQTVVYVVRDSDAAIDYWRTIAASPGLAADKARTARDELARVATELRKDTQETFAAGKDAAAPAYGLAARKKPVPAPIEVQVAGEAAAPVTADWLLARRLEPPAAARTLWSRAGEPLLVETQASVLPPRPRIGDDVESPGRDRTLILASAAPLLNGGLVDSGNRQLARDLVDRMSADARVVVVGSALVRPDADDEQTPSMWRLLAVQPHPWIAAQAVLGMLLFCWWKAPIFGRPRREDGRPPQDFGHHVEALAALLRRSRDDGFARGRVEAWRRPGERHEAGKTTMTGAEYTEETT
jgi:hypothetical protein